MEAPAWMSDSLTVSDVAKKIGKSRAYVTAHAEELGGSLAQNRWFDLGRSGHQWRFPRQDYSSLNAARRAVPLLRT
jgi:hypothetical protein